MDETTDPYTPPQSDVTVAAQESIPEPASKMRRFLNYLVDVVMQFLLAALLGIAALWLGGEEALVALENTPDLAISIPLLLFYYILLEGLFGITVGKLVTGTRVVNDRGLRPSFMQVLGRSLSRIIPFEAFSFLGETGRGWHDRFPNTYVVTVR